MGSLEMHTHVILMPESQNMHSEDTQNEIFLINFFFQIAP